MKLPVYNLKGERVEEFDFPAKIDRMKTNPDLVRQVAISLWGNSRNYTAHTKDRGEVRGGGKKPWKQKGTGRARAGSIRSPLWRGGGVTFGPRNERNYFRKINKKVARLGLMMGLKEKVREEEVKIVDSFSSLAPKTKELLGAVDTLLKARKKTLVVSESKNENLKRAGSNLPKITTKMASDLNLLDLLTHKFVLLEKNGLVSILERIAETKKKPAEKEKKQSGNNRQEEQEAPKS